MKSKSYYINNSYNESKQVVYVYSSTCTKNLLKVAYIFYKLIHLFCLVCVAKVK